MEIVLMKVILFLLLVIKLWSVRGKSNEVGMKTLNKKT